MYQQWSKKWLLPKGTVNHMATPSKTNIKLDLVTVLETKEKVGNLLAYAPVIPQAKCTCAPGTKRIECRCRVPNRRAHEPASGLVWVEIGKREAPLAVVPIYVQWPPLGNEPRALYIPTAQPSFIGYLMPGEGRSSIAKTLTAWVLAQRDLTGPKFMTCAVPWHSDPLFPNRNPQTWEGVLEIYDWAVYGYCTQCRKEDGNLWPELSDSQVRTIIQKDHMKFSQKYPTNAIASTDAQEVVVHDGDEWLRLSSILERER